MDAREHLALAQGEAGWPRLTDECGGAVPLTVVSPPGSRARVGAEEVRKAPRRAFADRGTPARTRAATGSTAGRIGRLSVSRERGTGTCGKT